MTRSHEDLARLRNLGAVSARWLRAIGVNRKEELLRRGAARVYCQVKAVGFPATRNLLWSLQGAILDIPWNDLPMEVRNSLAREVSTLEAEENRPEGR
jgi:DNA transformation protein